MAYAQNTKRKSNSFYVESKDTWASYGKTMDGLGYMNTKLKDGRRVQYFINKNSGLVVVDVIDKDMSGGKEILRRRV